MEHLALAPLLRMPCDKSTRMRGWVQIVPEISSVLTLNQETNKNHDKTYSRILKYAKVAIKLWLCLPPKRRLPKFGLGFPF